MSLRIFFLGVIKYYTNHVEQIIRIIFKKFILFFEKFLAGVGINVIICL